MEGAEFFKLPLGHADFVRLRAENCIYVDKTEAICRLCSEGGRIFIARPRRFGKSLLTSTFDSLFRRGLRDFQGLAIEKLWKEKTHDVVHLDFSEVCEFAHAEDFRRQFENLLISSFAAAGLPWEDKKGALASRIKCYQTSHNAQN
ncbi:AAA family ATPase, partial [uncultured Sutterella sp.]|uniref:AAA family ATPase n=1 Tax=uncultured Sutterella sp. TaxID=286133 RepID=UPI00261BF907